MRPEVGNRGVRCQGWFFQGLWWSKTPRMWNVSYPMGNIQLLHARLQIGKCIDYIPKLAISGESSVSHISAAVVSALRWLNIAYGIQNIPFLSLIRMLYQQQNRVVTVSIRIYDDGTLKVGWRPMECARTSLPKRPLSSVSASQSNKASGWCVRRRMSGLATLHTWVTA